jgi:hypothetical protein
MKVWKAKGEGRQLQLKYVLYNFNATCFGLSTNNHYQSKLEVLKAIV